ncbi:uncharacterized protein PV06_08237 [Exophiala oligosperma]|uniref:Zn(2)-C6 fungal-type domain-containing protein n=1 Tax=Exophiala oligosperma TaxID=215243 RepID=A0A0D2DB16_9EURO|nr:uncharacterized protein PV06_08237 [Exophiala oligosperma]KIW39640.1 hypothetical protein PV06_08237 [Exophiala oligosperma]
MAPSESYLIPGDRDYRSDGTSLYPAKRQRILACKRCRHRKQRCDGDGENPCSNCTNANAECFPTEPTLTRARYKADYVQSLERRLGQLERLLPHETPSQEDRSANEITTVLPQGEASRPVGSSNSSNLRVEKSVSPTQTHQSHNTHMSTSGTSASPSTNAFQSLTSVPHPLPRRESNIIGLVASLPSAHLQQQQQEVSSSITLEHYLNQLAVWPDGSIPSEIEEHLISVYFDKCNRRWPFMVWTTFYSWHTRWKNRSREGPYHDEWQGFFVNMLFAVALLLDPKNPLIVSHTSQTFYEQAVNNYLPAVLRQPNHLLHAQAYLMMSCHALFSPSAEQISLMISSAVRYCIVARFHLVESEPEPTDAAARLEIQMRRRVFWVAYGLDRLACGVLRLPFSISDDNITVPLFDDVDDAGLLQSPRIPQDPKTSVSSALHREKCFQIQSEILNVTMRADFSKNFDSLSDWRSYILSKLEHWRAQLPQAADTDTTSPTDERWILIVYNHCLLYLFIPSKWNVRGPAGDWSVRASTQTILIFRKFQGYRTVPHPMLGLISQFSIGITLLYCLWATPPKFRAEPYNSKNVFEAVRACSNNLAIITERWESTKDLADIFELLATEIPLAETMSHNGERAVSRVSHEAAEEIHSKLPHVKQLVLNREIIRMIEEMATEDFPRDDEDAVAVGSSYPGVTDNLSISGGPAGTGQTLFTNGLPLYQFPSQYLSNDSFVDSFSPGQALEFPGSLSGFDVF